MEEVITFTADFRENKGFDKRIDRRRQGGIPRARRHLRNGLGHRGPMTPFPDSYLKLMIALAVLVGVGIVIGMLLR
jgi:hypothetical protein